MMKTLMTGALILTAALPASAQVGPGLGVTDSISGRYSRSESYAMVCTKNHNGRLSLRTGPGMNFGKIKEIPNRHTVGLNYGQYGVDGFWWWNVYHNGYQGWVRADYVCGDPQ